LAKLGNRHVARPLAIRRRALDLLLCDHVVPPPGIIGRGTSQVKNKVMQMCMIICRYRRSANEC
jgi:hypothetical protein